MKGEPEIMRRSKQSDGEWGPWDEWVGYLQPVLDLLSIEHFESVSLTISGGNEYEYRRA